MTNFSNSPDRVGLFLRLWRGAAWLIFLFGLIIILGGIFMTLFYGSSFRLNDGLISNSKEKLLYQLGLFAAAWIAVFAFLLWVSRQRRTNGASEIQKPERSWRRARTTGENIRRKQYRPWRVSRNELTVSPICWPLKISAGSLPFLGGCAGLYFTLFKRSQTAYFEWQLNPGIVLPTLIFGLLLLIGYAIMFGVDATRFDLFNRTYHRSYGVFPFRSEAKGQIEKDLTELRVEPSGHTRAYPGDEIWKLSLVWRDGPAWKKEWSQYLWSEAGRIENGRNTAAAELEQTGHELAQLLHVPLRLQPAWWESPGQTPTDGDPPAVFCRSSFD